MKPSPILLAFAAACLIWNNAQAAGPASRGEPSAERPHVPAPDVPVKEHTGRETPHPETGRAEDTMVVTGQRPGIRAEEMKESVQHQARDSFLKFRLTLPRLHLPRFPM